MADTTTTNYNFTKPEKGASEDSWGDKLNANWDAADTQIKANADAVTANASAITTINDTSLPGKQPLDATLTSIAALGTAAGKALYTTGVDAWAEMDVTAAGRAFLDDADATAQRATLGLGTAALMADSADTDLSNDPDAALRRDIAKAYVDAQVAGSSWSYSASTATTSGTLFDVTAIPFGVSEVEILFNGVGFGALGNTSDMLIQLGDSGGLEATGYSSTSEAQSGSGQQTENATNGMVMRVNDEDRRVHGVMRLSKGAGNDWYQTHSTHLDNNSIGNGGGSKTLSGEISRLRVTSTGGQAFTAGSFIVKWRA